MELEGTVKAIVYSVNEEEVKNRMNKIYIKDLPQEYTFSKLTKLTFGSKNKKGNIPVSITAQAIRRVDVSTVISRLKGAQKSTVEQYLKELGVRDWTLYISPPVYIIRDWMPFLRNNIQIEIRTQ